MIEAIIRWSVGNRLFVLLAAAWSPARGCLRCGRRRWTPFPTCPTCRSSSRPAIRPGAPGGAGTR